MATINTYLYRQQDGAIPDAFWVKTVMMHSAGADVRREVVSCTRAAFLLTYSCIYRLGLVLVVFGACLSVLLSAMEWAGLINEKEFLHAQVKR
jgi:hypothetical protein